MKRDSWIFSIITLSLVSVTLMALARERSWIPWGQSPLHVKLVASSAKFLKPGMEVRLSGMAVGRLADISLSPDARIQGLMNIEREYAKYVGPSSHLRVDQDGIIGEYFLALTPDTSSLQLKPKVSDTIQLALEPPVDARDLLIAIVKMRMNLDSAISKAGGLAAKDLPSTLTAVRRGVSSFVSLADSLEKEVRTTAPGLRSALGDARGTLRQVGEAGSSAKLTSDEIRHLVQLLQKLLN